MRIVKLTAKNVKRLRAVEIEPSGDLVVIAGKNGAGKTSVLDSISYALGSKALRCKVPVRRGQDEAEIVCDLGDIVVRRTITPEGGGSLVVENAEGARYQTPQTMLDELVGRLSFDPLAFSRMKAGKQAETLRTLLGLDFETLDATRASLYATRTEKNRDVRSMQARHDGLPFHEDAPDVVVPSSSILAEIDEANAQNTINDATRGRLRAARVKRSSAADAVTTAEQEVERLESALSDAHLRVEGAQVTQHEHDNRVGVIEREVEALVDIDTAPLRERLGALEGENAKVRDNVHRENLAEEIDKVQREAVELTAQMAAIDAEKRESIAAADFPVEGLGFDEGAVMLNELPLDQASAAEQLRVSVGLGIAANPELRVLLIRDGSLLDEDSLELVATMAAENDAQVWIERVEDDEHVGIVIEDGMVASDD